MQILIFDRYMTISIVIITISDYIQMINDPGKDQSPLSTISPYTVMKPLASIIALILMVS